MGKLFNLLPLKERCPAGTHPCHRGFGSLKQHHPMADTFLAVINSVLH